ncbi:lipopolysaccharide biosynthesis protein [Comamonas suwonensis]|uniref:lipopolysaccharide biosynthesis protein n=1 Tax=Comamonas suwonensis TaxID=2606214 RepID=UPI00145E30F5|nr:hypothetical protein [Comamonas suwonensis]MBI1623070.1 hypothetical protein [Comamonas suwonensis]
MCWRPGGLASQGGVVFGWMLLRAAVQIATLVVLTRQLGENLYGQFVAIVAIASFIAPFSGLGLSHILLRNAARDPGNNYYLQFALRWWGISLPFCVFLTISIALWMLPFVVSIYLWVFFIATELISVSLTEICARYWQSHQRSNIYGAINVGLPGVRLIFLLFYVFLSKYVSLSDVLWVYVLSNLAYVLLLWVNLPPREKIIQNSMNPYEGLPFSFSAFSLRLQNEFNKPVLAQAQFGLTGSYNIAQRTVDMAILPLLALQEALWPRLYTQSNPMQQLRRTGTTLIILAIILGLILWVVAPMLPIVFGAGFAASVDVLQMLAWLPMLQVLRSLLNFDAIHHSRTKEIGWVSVLGGVVSVIGVTIFVPMHGMTGAVFVSYFVEGVMLFFLLIGALLMRRKSPLWKS